MVRRITSLWYGTKLSSNGISGNLLKLLRDFLYRRKQRVVLSGQNFSWDDVNAGLPRGSILDHYRFSFTFTIY